MERILGIILPVFSIIALGWLYGRKVRPDMSMVNRISMNVLAPALIFSALSSKSFDLWDNRLLMLGSVGVVLGSGLLAWPFAKLLHEDHRTLRAADDVQQLRQHGPAAGGARVRPAGVHRDGGAVHRSPTCCTSRSAPG